MARVLYEIEKARIPKVYRCDVDAIRPAFRETAAVFNSAITDEFFHVRFEEDRRALRLVGEGEGWAKLPRGGRRPETASLEDFVPRTARTPGTCKKCGAPIEKGDTFYGYASGGSPYRVCEGCFHDGENAAGGEDDGAEV